MELPNLSLSDWKRLMNGAKYNGISLTDTEIEQRYYVLMDSLKNSGCLICRNAKKFGEIEMIGLFAPNNSQEFGADGDKTRYIFYGLCFIHAELHMKNMQNNNHVYLNNFDELILKETKLLKQNLI